jgi:hypothetical protein
VLTKQSSRNSDILKARESLTGTQIREQKIELEVQPKTHVDLVLSTDRGSPEPQTPPKKKFLPQKAKACLPPARKKDVGVQNDLSQEELVFSASKVASSFAKQKHLNSDLEVKQHSIPKRTSQV